MMLLSKKCSKNTITSHIEINKVESHTKGSNFGDDERRKMHQDLCNIKEKYEEMSKKKGTSSSVHHLLNSIDLPYITEIMMVPPRAGLIYYGA